MKSARRIPDGPRPNRPLIVLVWVCSLVVYPFFGYVVIQSVRSHHKASVIQRLPLGVSPDEVTARAGVPESKSSDGHIWYYESTVPRMFDLPPMSPPTAYVEFSADNRLVYRGEYPD